MKRSRGGFTLVEILVVVGILLLLATLAVATLGGKNTDAMRSAARVTQSAFLGAKDRAMHAKESRGLRLIRDTNGPTFANGIPCLVNGFAYVQPIQHDPYGPGSIQLERLDVAPADGQADGPDVVLVRSVNADWNTAASFFAVPGQIRIPAASGQWYQFSVYAPGVLQLATPYAGTAQQPMPNPVAVLPANTSCDIQFANDVLPFHQPIALPSGCIVDLRYSSTNVQAMTGDIVFSPRGHIIGAIGGLGSLLLTLRDIGDATSGLDPSSSQIRGACLILAVNPQTGLVQTYDADLTDANADGIVDNLFTYAQNGKAAGR